MDMGKIVTRILSHRVIVDGHKVAIDWFDLETKERKRLAEQRCTVSSKPVTDDWVRDPVAFTWET